MYSPLAVEGDNKCAFVRIVSKYTDFITCISKETLFVHDANFSW